MGFFDGFSEAPLPTLITQHATLSWSRQELSDLARPMCRELHLLHGLTEQGEASWEAVMLTSGWYVVGTVSASLGLWQDEGGVSMNSSMLLSGTYSQFPCFGPHQLLRFPLWSWDQLPCWF